MNRIDELFLRKKERILNVYCTAGFPFPDSTLKVMRALQNSGADMIELGIPYSDPLADGPVIQASGARAIEGGMTVAKLLNDIRDFRSTIHLPVILMGYMNPVLQYGFERFCADASAAGIDGLILPDLPMYEFETEYKHTIEQYNLKFVFLVTPETSPERIIKLDSLSTGFLYAVSSSSTTGNDKAMGMQEGYFRKLHDMKLKNPVLIGFGIKDKSSFDAACEYASGAIIGTAFIRAVEKTAESGEPAIETITEQFIDAVIG